MPTAAVLSTQLTTTRAFSLYIRGGLDVLKEPGTLGTSYGAPIEKIGMTEAGPGGVSSMDFEIDDPLKAITLQDGDDVQFHDNTNDVMLFRGYVDHWSFAPDFGGQGRTIKVSCIGVEAWLDWCKVFPAGVTTGAGGLDAQIIALGTQLGSPLRIDSTANGGHVEINLGPAGSAETMTAGVTVPAGTTFREAIRILTSAAVANPASYPGNIPVVVHATVDANFNLYVWADGDPLTGILITPPDWADLIVTDDAASGRVAEGLSYEVEPGDVVHEVYVNGANAAGSGLFGDGTGIRSRQDVIDEPDSTTAALAQVLATQYLGAQADSVRGSFSLTDWTPLANVHAGSSVRLTDVTIGVAVQTFYRMMQIDKTFNASGRQNWKVSFGGTRPSAIKALRRLTRDTLS